MPAKGITREKMLSSGRHYMPFTDGATLAPSATPTAKTESPKEQPAKPPISAREATMPRRTLAPAPRAPDLRLDKGRRDAEVAQLIAIAACLRFDVLTQAENIIRRNIRGFSIGLTTAERDAIRKADIPSLARHVL